MRSPFPKLFLGAVILSQLPLLTAEGRAFAIEPAASLLSDRFGDYKAVGAATSGELGLTPSLSNEFGEISVASRLYLSKDGTRYWLTVVTTDSDSGAYALLTNTRRAIEGYGVSNGKLPNAGVGTESFLSLDRLLFFKGPTCVAVRQDGATTPVGPSSLINIAKSFAETIDKGEGEIPVLVKHLPNWESVRQRIVYAVEPNTLRGALRNQRVLEAVDFEGGAEAVVANYDSATLVIIEFNTARIAGDNDWNIRTKINELRSPNQAVAPMPSAYRRVGNYSVFVFDAPSEQAANQLIDQVKYQQVVQWLGENPYLYENAQREFVETTLGVFVAVVKGSGLALVACFGIGGFFGALLFVRRRAQQRAVEGYSDAGGMVRLNLDEITPQADPGRLLGGGN